MTQTALLTPHGPSFSFVDTCEVFESEMKAVGSKWLDPKSAFFESHFPGRPLMPGVLMVECAAQVAGILWQTVEKADSKAPLLLAQILQFRLMKTVLPDQTIRIEVVLEKKLGNLAQFSAELAVGSEVVARGGFMLSR
jgi:3-hydroxyacyl-[acyl-carrier-protein] dehydratase